MLGSEAVHAKSRRIWPPRDFDDQHRERCPALKTGAIDRTCRAAVLPCCRAARLGTKANPLKLRISNSDKSSPETDKSYIRYAVSNDPFPISFLEICTDSATMLSLLRKLAKGRWSARHPGCADGLPRLGNASRVAQGSNKNVHVVTPGTAQAHR
jgi:hypothetical protein